jgi:hypothetical protein
MHNGCEVEVIEDGNRTKILRTYGYHDSSLEWGSGGSGPSELALAILLDYFDELPTIPELYLGATKAQRYHQDFKWAFIAGLEPISWEITGEEIRSWLDARNAAGLFGQNVRVVND